MNIGIKNINHIVVAVMENRSFDNLLGWLYADRGNQPPLNIPNPSAGPPVYKGLQDGVYYNTRSDLSATTYATRPPKDWQTGNPSTTVPNPDPQEEFDDVTYQIYTTKTPVDGDLPNMGGFLENYYEATNNLNTAKQIMQGYGPAEANVINQLAENFAVCDHWYASCPTETWPNRAFIHTGTSGGHINNPPSPYLPWDIETVFNVLEDRGIPWNVFNDGRWPSLTKLQFWPKLLFFGSDRFQDFGSFSQLCAGADGKRLPAYSFVEPRFQPEPGALPNDFHPPHDVALGEKFLADIYNAVRSSPYRDDILLIITFDEHGGCYDHVAPPTNAATPFMDEIGGNFKFDRFGIRVPAIVISSYVKPGTVFRAPSDKPVYDHTSILATLRDWIDAKFGAGKFLTSLRIGEAPTLEAVLTLGDEGEKNPWPAIQPDRLPVNQAPPPDKPLSEMQQSILHGTARMIANSPEEKALKMVEVAPMKTYQHAIQFFQAHVDKVAK